MRSLRKWRLCHNTAESLSLSHVTEKSTSFCAFNNWNVTKYHLIHHIYQVLNCSVLCFEPVTTLQNNYGEAGMLDKCMLGGYSSWLLSEFSAVLLSINTIWTLWDTLVTWHLLKLKNPNRNTITKINHGRVIYGMKNCDWRMDGSLRDKLRGPGGQFIFAF